MGLVITYGFLVTGIFHSGTYLSPASKSLKHIGVKVWLSSISTERGASIPKGRWTHRYKQQDTWETYLLILLEPEVLEHVYQDL